MGQQETHLLAKTLDLMTCTFSISSTAKSPCLNSSLFAAELLTKNIIPNFKFFMLKYNNQHSIVFSSRNEIYELFYLYYMHTVVTKTCCLNLISKTIVTHGHGHDKSRPWPNSSWPLRDRDQKLLVTPMSNLDFKIIIVSVNEWSNLFVSIFLFFFTCRLI